MRPPGDAVTMDPARKAISFRVSFKTRRKTANGTRNSHPASGTGWVPKTAFKAG
jgi:hypothetical protein